MKRYDIPFRNVYDIVATCMILHNLHIVNNERSEDKSIVEVD
jgi:hypothetical protein